MRARLAACGVLLVAVVAAAQEMRAITMDWVFSDAAAELTALPTTCWTSANDVLLLDPRRPEAERTLERLDPRTGKRTDAVERAKAFASLAALAGKDALPKALPWPESLDRAGKHAAYVFAGDVFLLDLAASRFERLTRTPSEESIVRLSPDGARVAYVRDHDVWMTDLAGRAETRLTADGAATVLNGSLSWVYWEEVSVDHEEDGYWWSDDSQAIAFLRTDESAVSTIPWVDFKQPVPAVIQQRYPKAGGVNPSVRLGIVDVRSGTTAWLDRDKAPYEYILRVGWLPDSSRVAVQVTNRAQTRLDLLFVERASGEAKRVLSDPDEAWVTIHDLQFLADGRFVWSSERDGYTHLYLYNANGTLANRLTSGEWSVRGTGSFYGAPLGAATVDEAGGFVYFTALEKASVERHVYRVRLDGSGFERLSREDGTHRPTFSPDRRFFVDAHSSHDTLPSLSLRAADGAVKSMVAPPRNDLLASLDIRFPEMATIPAADGFALPASVYKPKAFDPAHRYPVIVNPYGGPSAPTVRDAFSGGTGLFDQVLLGAGYVVVNVDNRSATGISKTLENAVVRNVWSDGELADLTAAVRWLKAQSWVDPERVGIWGWSGGGTFTLLAMTRSSEFKAGIAVAPLVDGRFYDTKFEETYMKTPADNPQGYEHIALQQYAKDLHGRLLLVFGTYDDNVHPQNGWSFADELIKADILFDMMVYPMRQHGIADKPARLHLFNTMLEFWKRNL
jgi:dipeptidyl-peptidase-4